MQVSSLGNGVELEKYVVGLLRMYFSTLNFDAFQLARCKRREKQPKNENLPLRKNGKQPKGTISLILMVEKLGL